jgi:uncharacterized protein (DUF433 family)
MSTLREVEKQVTSLSPSEKAELLQRMERDLAGTDPGIESSPDVCGGEPCISGTWIPVWTLERARQLGSSEADVLRAFPTLRAQDLVNAWAYVESHREEIEQQIRENEEAQSGSALRQSSSPALTIRISPHRQSESMVRWQTQPNSRVNSSVSTARQADMLTTTMVRHHLTFDAL